MSKTNRLKMQYKIIFIGLFLIQANDVLSVVDSRQVIPLSNSGEMTINSSGIFDLGGSNQQRSKKSQPPVWKKALITVGSLVGVSSAYGALYYYNSIRDKPLLNSLFQQAALKRVDDFNTKYANIVSNFSCQKVDEENHAVRIEAHIYDHVSITDDMSKDAIEESIRSNTKKPEYVILNLSGMSDDIRIYQDLEKKGRSIMGSINQKTGFPVVTMNLPPMGGSKIDDRTAFSINDNYKAAQYMVETISELYATEPQKIILWGECLGGIVAAWLAAHYNSQFVFLDAVPTTVDAVLATPLQKVVLAPIKPFVLKKEDFDLSDSLKRIDGEIIVRHNPSDQIANFERSMKSYKGMANVTKYTNNKLDLHRKNAKQYNHCLDKISIADIIKRHVQNG